MPAFTYLCKKTNISIAHSTITIYEINGADFNGLYKPGDPTNVFATRITPVQPVYRNHNDHHNFHDDRFNKDWPHYHLKFTVNIEEPHLTEFLTILVEKKIIDRDEKESCLAAFRQASNDQMSEYYEQLRLMQLKVFDLIAKAQKNPEQYKLAVSAAIKLYYALKNEIRQYTNNKNAETYKQFQKNCELAIDEARPVLEKHRGWKEVLVNLGAAVVGLGVFYVVALAVNYSLTGGRHLFFHCKTDSEQIVDQCAIVQREMLRI